NIDDDPVHLCRCVSAGLLQGLYRYTACLLAFLPKAHRRESALHTEGRVRRNVVLGCLGHEMQLVSAEVHQRPREHGDDERHRRDNDGLQARSHCRARPGVAVCACVFPLAQLGSGAPSSGICNASSSAPSARCVSSLTASARCSTASVSSWASVSSTRSACPASNCFFASLPRADCSSRTR